MAIRARCRRWAGDLYTAVFLLRAYKEEWNGWSHSLCTSTCAQEAVAAVHGKGR